MKLQWRLPVLAVAVAALAACNQRAPLSPSVQAGSDSAVQPDDRGNGAPRGKLVFSWNLIGTPGDYEGGCGNGRRVFVERGANHEHILFQDFNDGWSIAQCDATFGDEAVIHSDNLGVLDVYARILGKPGGRLFVCADTVADHETAEDLCLLGTINLTRDGGKSKFQFQPDELFDASVEDIIWSVETNSDFRIAQFRVYQTSPQ